MTDSFAVEKDRLMAKAESQLGAAPGSRHSLREKIALTCRVLFDDGQGAGLAGQITARGERPGSYYTQRFGLAFNETCASNLLLVDEDLQVLAGEGLPNAANRFHSWIYRARPEVGCIIHTHALYASTLSQLELPLVVSHMDNCCLYEDVAFLGQWPGVPFGNEEGRLIAEALGDKRGVLLSHHGLLVAGRSVEEACVLAVTFERTARMQLLGMAAGTIKPIDPARGQEAHDWLNKPRHMQVAFDNLARQSLRTHDDCLA